MGRSFTNMCRVFGSGMTSGVEEVCNPTCATPSWCPNFVWDQLCPVRHEEVCNPTRATVSRHFHFLLDPQTRWARGGVQSDLCHGVVASFFGPRGHDKVYNPACATTSQRPCVFWDQQTQCRLKYC